MQYTIYYSLTDTLILIVEFDGTRSELEALVKAVMAGDIKEPDKFPVKALNKEVCSVLHPEFKVTITDSNECPVIVKNNSASNDDLESNSVDSTSFREEERSEKYKISHSHTTTRLLRVEFSGTKSELEALIQALVLKKAENLRTLPAKYVHAEVWSSTEPRLEVIGSLNSSSR